ncbi:reverse transcriptase domain-containing protein [Tanacetum coccineum]|uniref:Reverse transcriptase domain-containing protein n=1 Tax=Tanacetum coccineum TaxID=301880 RepID=A0ABQ5DY95_9ASTR
MAEGDKEKTAFFTREGVFFYKRLPFRLKNAGVTYQKLVDKVFCDQIGRNLEVYVDDIVIKRNFEEDMLVDIKEIFEKLRPINMKLNPRKCSFGVEEGPFTATKDDKINTKPQCKIGHSELVSLKGRRQDTTFLENIKELHKWEDGLVDDISRKSLSKHERVHRDINNEPEPENTWKLFTDGASSSDGSGAGLMLVSPKGKQYTYALRFEFKTTNKETEYKALLARLPIATEMKIQKLAIFVDSQLVANQVKGLFEARKPVIKQYLEKTKEILKSFNSYSMKHVQRDQNKKVDALSKLASMTFSKLSKKFLVEVVQEKSIIQKEVAYVVNEEGDNWMLHIRPRSVVSKITKLGYYWPSMHDDAKEIIQRCKAYQIHSPIPRKPKQEMTSITGVTLVYGSEAVVPIEISVETKRIQGFDVKENKKRRRGDLDILEERREIASIKEAYYKQNLERFEGVL